MRSIRILAALVILCATGLACASAGGSGPRRAHDRISPEEIIAMENQVSDLYDLVSRLRPRWLNTRAARSMAGSSIVVYQDLTLLGGPAVLREFGLDFALSLQYLDASQAVAQLPGLGSRRIGGAIVINTRQP